MEHSFIKWMALLGSLMAFVTACENPLVSFTDDFGELSYEISIEDFEGWSYDSHSADAEADYESLFDNNTTKVHRIDITISSDNYELMEADMTSLYGTYGRAGGVSIADSDPIYVPVTLEYDDQTWWFVGMRYKGNSSLRDAWQSGIHKLPFRLDFDHFDYIWDFTDNQRFWGFEKMTFSNGKNDETLLRDMLASELYLQGNVEAANASFCRVYIDVGNGEGSVYWGLYTMIEDPSDQMLEDQFGDDSGNLYKPDNEEESTLSADNFDTEYYEKKTNENSSDWDDIIGFIDELNYSIPTDGSIAWTDLETLFDVDHFLNYLAINNTIQNWDVYGSKAHNYYLYADPSESGQFTWFPWDLNESFTADSKCLSLNVSNDYSSGEYDDWPLLENVLGLSYYQDLYMDKVKAYFYGTTSTYQYDDIEDQVSTYSSLIKEFVLDEIDGYSWLDSDFDSDDYDTAVSSLKSQISGRFTTVADFIE